MIYVIGLLILGFGVTVVSGYFIMFANKRPDFQQMAQMHGIDVETAQKEMSYAFFIGLFLLLSGFFLMSRL